MFGPNSAGFKPKDKWTNLKMVYDPLTDQSLSRGTKTKVKFFLELFSKRDCNMVEMTSAEHDRQAAESRSVPLAETQIDTGTYSGIKRTLKSVSKNSDDMFEAMYRCNQKNCDKLLAKLE